MLKSLATTRGVGAGGGGGGGGGGLQPPQYLTSSIIPSNPVNLQIKDQPFSLDTNVTTDLGQNWDTVKCQLIINNKFGTQ